MASGDRVPELLDRIEDLEFAADISVASSLAGFKFALGLQPEFTELAQAAFCDPRVRITLYERVRRLSAITVDARYQNPFDIPMAAYLASLEVSRSPEAVLAALAASEASNTWRTDFVASEILAPKVAEQSADNSSYTVGPVHDFKPFKETTESVFITRFMTHSLTGLRRIRTVADADRVNDPPLEALDDENAPLLVL